MWKTIARKKAEKRCRRRPAETKNVAESSWCRSVPSKLAKLELWR